uniref:Ribonuclease T(2) n=1 Tax=Heligmosomoides polygyrus TaxID=6339 RepID=A0A183FFF2_HELPZ
LRILPGPDSSTAHRPVAVKSTAKPPDTAIHQQAVCCKCVPDSCEIPTDTPDWSIHGLWPNYKNGSYPQFCDGVPRKFDVSLIKTIEVTLRRMWPNLYPTKTAESFWKHEWEKHGTCAQNLGNLSSELLYFKTCVNLKRLDIIEAAFYVAEIVPRTEPHLLEDIRGALKKELSNGMHVQINCLTDKKTRQILLGDVRMCIDKSFRPIDCPHSKDLQPAVYIQGHPPPLPSFKVFPLLFLSSDSLNFRFMRRL